MAGGAAGGALAGMLIANNKMRLDKGLKEAQDAWKGLVDENLALVQIDGRPILKGEVEGVSVVLEVTVDFVAYAHTRVVATAISSAKATVGVYPQPPGVLGKLRSLIGQDIEVGDPAFDGAFLIHGNPESAPRKLLTREVRDLLSGLAGKSLASFDYDSGKVTLQLTGVETDPNALRVAIAVASKAARAAL